MIRPDAAALFLCGKAFDEPKERYVKSLESTHFQVGIIYNTNTYAFIGEAVDFGQIQNGKEVISNNERLDIQSNIFCSRDTRQDT